MTTSHEALRRCVEVLRLVDFADCGEKEELWQKHALALAEAELVLKAHMVKCDDCEGKGGIVTDEGYQGDGFMQPPDGPTVERCEVCEGSGLVDPDTAIVAVPPTAEPAAKIAPLVSIDEMCKILDAALIKADEYTDCTILYKVTFEQLRSLYMKGIAAAPLSAADAKDAERWRKHLSMMIENGHRVREVGATIDAVDAAIAKEKAK